jgi:hypothetical protein
VSEDEEMLWALRRTEALRALQREIRGQVTHRAEERAETSHKGEHRHVGTHWGRHFGGRIAT